MTSFLPATGNDTQRAVQNLRAARQDLNAGGGTGETYLKVNDKTGEMTFGAEGTPLPKGMRWVIGLHAFYHGYVNMQGGKVVERNVVSMAAQSVRPRPAGGYGTYEEGGPRNVTEIVLSSIDEPGFNLTFTAWGPSNANRLDTLMAHVDQHAESADGQAGFVHPIVIVKSSSYRNDRFRRDVHHIDFSVVDWLHTDGKTLLSEHGGVKAVANGGSTNTDSSSAPPWEDDDGMMTAAERELLDA